MWSFLSADGLILQRERGSGRRRPTLSRVMVRPSYVFPMSCLLIRLASEAAMVDIQDSIWVGFFKKRSRVARNKDFLKKKKKFSRPHPLPASHRGPGVVLGVAVGLEGGAGVGLAVHGFLQVVDQNPEKDVCVSRENRSNRFLFLNVLETHLCSMPLCCSWVCTRSRYKAGTWMSTFVSTTTCSAFSGLQKSVCDGGGCRGRGGRGGEGHQGQTSHAGVSYFLSQ